ncbi:MAG: acyl-[acyl-carrier-protein] thioesterase [Gammaproteobacteria bacterium]|nr:MAG: acyl-[acyl-carrier-protein] thioesterase [Gammaproteobacteria bacterium]
MTKKDLTIFEKTYTVNILNSDINGRLGLLGLLDILQDIADEHANSVGLTYEVMLNKGFFWVMFQQRTMMKRWPTFDEKFTVRTWARSVKNRYAVRESEIIFAGDKIGACSTTLMLLDAKTHRPKRLSSADLGFEGRTDYQFDFKTEKIRLPELKPARDITVQISDLDINQHVSNTRYAEWILNTLPIDYHRRYTIEEYSANFINETFFADDVQCLSRPQLSEVMTDEILHFSGVRHQDNKTVFKAKLISRPNQHTI